MTGAAFRSKPEWEPLRKAYLRAGSPEAQQDVREQMRRYFLGEAPPLSAWIDQNGLDKDRQILLFQPTPRDRANQHLVFEFDFDAAPGSEVLLRKAAV